MFCTECGQSMVDEAKFCAFCGTRRLVTPSSSDAPAPAVPPRVDAPVVTPPPSPVRTVRSTAEIMQMRVHPAQWPPVEEPPRVEPEPAQPVATWAEEESAAPPMFPVPTPAVVRERA